MRRRTVLRQDLELLSDLIDGKLTKAERAEALRRVESEEGMYEVLVETARYGEAGQTPVVRARSSSFSRWPSRIPRKSAERSSWIAKTKQKYDPPRRS